MTNTDEQALVERTLAGDREAFGELVQRFHKPVYNVALRMLRKKHDAEDVTQAVFLKAFERLNQYNPKYRFFSWIYKMTINEALNFARRDQRTENLFPTGIEPASDTAPPDMVIETEEKLGQMEEALMFLQPEQRALIVLKHFHDLSYREIGFIVEAPEKTVKSRLYEARQRLRDVFVRKGFV